MLILNQEKYTDSTKYALKKQTTPILVLSILMVISGLFCLINPLLSGITVSVIIGVFLLVSGIILLITSVASHDYFQGWNLFFSVAMGIAYLLLGYSLIVNPISGLIMLAVLIAALFIIGGFLRFYAGVQQIKSSNGPLNLLIALLDFIIAYYLIGKGSETSILFITTLIGIQLLFSAFSLLILRSQIKKL